MRPFWIGPAATTAVALLMAACGQAVRPTSAAAPQTPPAQAALVNPANIKRVGRDLPAGYEVSSQPRVATPGMIWGMSADVADLSVRPPLCGHLADPENESDQTAQGISGSGAGGIVDAVVVAVRPGPVELDPDIVAACGHWTMSSERTRVVVDLVDAPPIDDAETLGMVTDVRTLVESGTEINMRTYTFIAYLADYYAFAALTTDPGAVHSPLPPQFAADLLVKTVSTLRS